MCIIYNVEICINKTSSVFWFIPQKFRIITTITVSGSPAGCGGQVYFWGGVTCPVSPRRCHPPCPRGAVSLSVPAAVPARNRPGPHPRWVTQLLGKGSPSAPHPIIPVVPPPEHLPGYQMLQPRQRASRCFCSIPKFSLRSPPTAVAPETEPTEPGPLGECLTPPIPNFPHCGPYRGVHPHFHPSWGEDALPRSQKFMRGGSIQGMLHPSLGCQVTPTGFSSPPFYFSPPPQLKTMVFSPQTAGRSNTPAPGSTRCTSPASSA